jgi:peptidoglycan DL-endopeptidase CwlO
LSEISRFRTTSCPQSSDLDHDPSPGQAVTGGRVARLAAWRTDRRRRLVARLGAMAAALVTAVGVTAALVLSPVATPEVKAAAPASAGVFHQLHFKVSQATSFRAEAALIALRQRGKPYRYGARGPGAFDCSGLTSFAYANAGREIPRTSRAQRGATATIARGDLQPGDLLFYRGHVTMYVGESGGRQWMVEAPSSGKKVRVVALRTKGLRKIGRVRA